MVSFALPMAFTLLGLPFLVRRLLPPQRTEGGALRVPDSIAHRLGAGGSGRLGRRLKQVLPALVWLLLVTALAGPRIVTPTPALPVSGRDITIALDLSGSMERPDFALDGKDIRRVDAVKKVASEFIRHRQGDRIGLVVFAEKSYFAAPPTFDSEGVAQALEAASIGIAGRSTAIGDGLGLAIKRLAKSTARSKVVILLSDGSNNAGSVGPKGVAQLAHDLGIRIHTIAMGPHDLGDGSEDPEAVDSGTLRDIAEESGGQFFRVKTTADLAAVTGTINRMETDPTKAPASEIYLDLWIWPASLAFLLVLALMIAEGEGAAVLRGRLRLTRLPFAGRTAR